MIEKVSPAHIDKVADRIGGALVDYAYSKEESPKIAVEVMLGHGLCTIIAETSVTIPKEIVKDIVDRIAGECWELKYIEVPQDSHLAKNQEGGIKCGDNGIFTGKPLTVEETDCAVFANRLFDKYKTDGKYIYDKAWDKLIVCQSGFPTEQIVEFVEGFGLKEFCANPLGDWEADHRSDVGLTGRKLGSDMGKSVSGGSIIGKDCSKADVSANIYCWLKAQQFGIEISAFCAIGASEVVVQFGESPRTREMVPYSEMVRVAKEYIDNLGGFEKLAEWGLV